MNDLLFAKTNPDWKSSWQNKIFRKKFYIGIIVLMIILATFPVFFQYIEKRQGIELYDWLLKKIPPRNVSLIIFICIWITSLLFIIRAFKQPLFFLTFLYAYCILSIFRIISI